MYRRSDRNQAEIIKTLRRHGVAVLCLSDVGHGCPDILCGLADERNVLIEIKNLDGHGSRLTEDEGKFLQSWPGECHIVTSPDQALKVLGIE